MLKKWGILAIFIFFSSTFSAQKSAILPMPKFQFLKGNRSLSLKNRKTEEHSKLIAAGLDLSLGLFGVHRLYLGTSPQVPVIYMLTLGGGGFIMLTDLGVILFTKDLEQFTNDPHVIMWAESNKEP